MADILSRFEPAGLAEAGIAEPARLRRSGGRRFSAMFFAEYFPPYMGSDRRIFELARNVEDWGVEFAVVPPLRILGGRCEDALQKYFERHFIENASEDERGGIHGHYFNLPRWLFKSWSVIGMPAAYALTLAYLVRRAVAHIRARRPDLIVVSHPSYLCGAVGLIAAKIARVPTLLDYPDAWTPLAIETSGIAPTGWMARTLRVLEARISRLPDRIVSITHGLTAYVRALGAKAPVDVVANGGDEKHFNMHNLHFTRASIKCAADDEIVLYSGRLEAWSGVHELVETIAQVVEVRPKALFVFVGDGTTAAQLLEEVKEHGLSDRVRFLGFQKYADMPSIVALADVAIVPFPHTPTTEICSPVKLFEYLLMHKPIITTDLPGVRESVSEEHVTFVRDLRAQHLAPAIVDLLANPLQSIDMADRGFDHCIKHFTWQALAQQFSTSMTTTLLHSKVPV